MIKGRAFAGKVEPPGKNLPAPHVQSRRAVVSNHRQGAGNAACGQLTSRGDNPAIDGQEKYGIPTKPGKAGEDFGFGGGVDQPGAELTNGAELAPRGEVGLPTQQLIYRAPNVLAREPFSSVEEGHGAIHGVQDFLLRKFRFEEYHAGGIG